MRREPAISNRRRRARRCSALAVMLVLAGACSENVPADHPLRRTTLFVPEQLGLSYRPLEAKGGARGDWLISLGITNRGREGLTISDLEPVADAGLAVEVLGYSDCRKGCPGAVPWSPRQEQRWRQKLTGARLASIPPGVPDAGSLVNLVLRIRPSDRRGEQALRKGCLFLRGFRVTSRGRTVLVAAPEASWVAALRLDQQPLPPGYEDCRP